MERRIFLSLERHGIHTPLMGMTSEKDTNRFILLDGFKRYRCARKLGIEQVPVNSVSTDTVTGFLTMLRQNDSSPLNLLEQASFIHDLHTHHKLSMSEIARRVDKSVSWVSVRISLISTMSEEIREKIIRGAFPLRSYMYTLAPFTRVKGYENDVAQFVHAVSGHHFSIRDISLLSKAFFNKETEIKEQILTGNIDWTLRMLKQTKESEPRDLVKTCRWHISELLRVCRNNPDVVPKIQEALDVFISTYRRYN
ncbi:MAG: hypothetical protein PVI26_05970 [Chitinispirillia bacterium]